MSHKHAARISGEQLSAIWARAIGNDYDHVMDAGVPAAGAVERLEAGGDRMYGPAKDHDDKNKWVGIYAKRENVPG